MITYKIERIGKTALVSFGRLSAEYDTAARTMAGTVGAWSGNYPADAAALAVEIGTMQPGETRTVSIGAPVIACDSDAMDAAERAVYQAMDHYAEGGK